MESPRSQHTAISCQYVPEHDNRRLNLYLGGWSRLDSSTQRLCWVAWSPRRLHLWPTIIEILHTLVDIYQSGALLLVRVESHRSTQQFYWVAWSRAARDGFCGRGCDVLVSMFPRSEILIEREKKKSEAQLVANTYWNMTIEGWFCAWEGGVAWIPAHSSYVGLRGVLGGCTCCQQVSEYTLG